MPNNAPHNALRHHVSGAIARGEAMPIVAIEADDYDVYYPHCPACGDPIDYCQGHGEIGDPVGAQILAAHEWGEHNNCNPRGCDDAPNR